MSHALGQKGFECLLFIGANKDLREFEYADWQRRWEKLCDRWGEKPVLRTLESLDRRGYIDYGVSPPFGWITAKGVVKLIEYATVVLRPQFSPQSVENGARSASEAAPGAGRG